MRPRTQKQSRRQPGSVRIIAGEWRGRRLPVADIPGLRPTGDRVRETLFNWLQPRIAGARVLDLFAGTGVLGLEAVSRGAREAVLVEQDRQAVANLRSTVEMLGAADRVEVIRADGLGWLGTGPPPFDLIFLDPPFEADLWNALLEKIPAYLSAGGQVYLENPASVPPALPDRYQIDRDKIMGEVQLRLLTVAHCS
ncbi:MAG: 16S rRNA (guanine(966)-N(2))-methyltransferase RsmD [Xanthomonadales bacterium]|nr:16S rRNA (guanine(966)-N(2))-methyltransferase RsmD [Xanthomonadales bacterium]